MSAHHNPDARRSNDGCSKQRATESAAGDSQPAAATVRLALCLSGGGFRAALFHLGVLRRLHELGVMRLVTTISSVSGGSVLSAFLADRVVRLGKGSLAELEDYEIAVAVPFRAFVSRDLRTAPVLAHAAWNWALPSFRAAAMVRRYRRRLTDLKLVDLPQHPAFVFCATDVSFGVNWVFTRQRVGDYLAGYAATPPDLGLAFAVAASACFPPVFGPMRVPIDPGAFAGGNYRASDRARILGGLSLTDGGLYDNLGLEPALRNHDWAIVSDAGGPFPFTASRAPLIRYMRYPNLVMKQVGSLRKRQLMSLIDDRRGECELVHDERCKVGTAQQPCALAADERCKQHGERHNLTRGAYLGLASDVAGYVPKTSPDTWAGYSRDLVKGPIAAIRTDLDRFTAAEQRILENHGYMLCDAAIRRHLAELYPASAPQLAIPHPEWLDEDRARRALATSHRRLSLRRLLKSER